MRAWMSRKQRRRPLRTQTPAASSQRSTDENGASKRDSGAENAGAASAATRPSLCDEPSTSHGFRPLNHGSSNSLGSSQAPSTWHEAATSQPCCSVSAEHKAGIVWPRPLLESSEEPSETLAPGSVGFFPFFGVRNILNYRNKGGKEKLISRRNVEDASQSETEAIESNILKWETYESPHEEPQSQKYKGHMVVPEADTALTSYNSSERQCVDANRKTMACTDIIACEPSTDSFAARMDPVSLANEISPHSPTVVEVDEYSGEGGQGLWSTLVDGRNRRSSLEAMSAEEIEIGEKVAGWDPSQEDNYALQSPGELELFDEDIADTKNIQGSQNPVQFGTCSEHSVNHVLVQPSEKAAATTDHGIYDDLNWMIEEPDNRENGRFQEMFRRTPAEKRY
ncbi:hypothetical protein MRX96_021257 [Rhipicephalus microplus]